MPPFVVEYYCPRQSPNWQRGRTPYQSFQLAIYWANAMKPQGANARARVIDAAGRVVYTV